jgi:hypothetical protein
MASASLALDAVKSGAVDLYYAEPSNSLAQDVPVLTDSRFVQNFQNLASGTQVFTIPPGQGITNVILCAGYSAATLQALYASYGVNWALPKGFLYSAIDRVSWRVAGSSEYYLTGQQLLLRNLRMVRTQPQADALLNLGGNEVKAAADYTVDQLGYVPLSFWKSPSTDGYEVPLNSDLLGSQIQIRVYLKSPKDFWASINAGTGAPPTQFDTGFFQMEALTMMNRAQSLAVKEDMSKDTYVAPLRAFEQQVLTAQIPTGWARQQQVTLTGFMSGEIRGVVCWLVDNALTNANSETNVVAPKEVRVAYSGLVYASYENGVSQIFNLMDSSKPSIFNTNLLTNNGATWSSAPVLGSYAYLPFAQPTASDFEAQILTRGLSVQNGALQFFLTVPDNTKAYTFYCSPVLNGAVAYSRGSAQILIG